MASGLEGGGRGTWNAGCRAAGVIAGKARQEACNGTRSVPLGGPRAMLDFGLGRAAVGWVGATGATPAASAQRAAIAGGVTGAEIPSLPRTAGRAHGRCQGKQMERAMARKRRDWRDPWRPVVGRTGRDQARSVPPRSDRPGCALRGRASRVVAGCARQPSARRAAIAALPAGRLEASALGTGLA